MSVLTSFWNEVTKAVPSLSTFTCKYVVLQEGCCSPTTKGTSPMTPTLAHEQCWPIYHASTVFCYILAVNICFTELRNNQLRIWGTLSLHTNWKNLINMEHIHTQEKRGTQQLSHLEFQRVNRKSMRSSFLSYVVN